MLDFGTDPTLNAGLVTKYLDIATSLPQLAKIMYTSQWTYMDFR